MSFRHVLTAVALAVVGVVLVGQVRRLLADPTVWPPDDFIEYWAAAKLTLDGANPYDGEQLLPLERAGGRDTDEAVMMWNPPWTLTFVLPLGLFPSRAGQLLWLAANMLVMGFCGDRLWRLFGGSAGHRWVGWLVALSALPTGFALQSGQIGPVLLLGAVVFLGCERRGWHHLAGAATVLLAVKPHLAYLVWVAILCRSVTTRDWRMVVGGAAAGLACSAFPLLFDPHVWDQYIDAMTHRPPEQWLSPTIGSLLRLAFGGERFWLQFVPVLVGLAWFAWHWRARRGWDWTEQLPLLLLVSFVTAPYGAWPFDMVLLLPAATWLVVNCSPVSATRSPAGTIGVGREPVTPTSPPHGGGEVGPAGDLIDTENAGAHGEAARGWFVLAGLLGVNLGCLALRLADLSSFWFLWVSPTVLLVYVVGAWKGPLSSPSPRLPFPPSSARVSA